MPWLVRDEDDPSKNLLFVHVPRCGGTSLTKHFKVSKKCRSDARVGCWRRVGLLYWFYRYRLLEGSNFPLITWENLIAATQYVLAIILISTLPVYRANNDDEVRFIASVRVSGSLREAQRGPERPRERERGRGRMEADTPMTKLN